MSKLITRRDFIKGFAGAGALFEFGNIHALEFSEGFGGEADDEEIHSGRPLHQEIYIVQMNELTSVVGIGKKGEEACSKVAGMERQYGKVQPAWTIKCIPGNPDNIEVLENCLRKKAWIWLVGSFFSDTFWSARSCALALAQSSETGCLVCTVVPKEWHLISLETFRSIDVLREKECWITLENRRYTENASRLIMDIHASLAFHGPIGLDFLDFETVASKAVGCPLFFNQRSLSDLQGLECFVSMHFKAFSEATGMFAVFSHSDLNLVEIDELQKVANVLIASMGRDATVTWGAILKANPDHSLRGTIMLTRSNEKIRKALMNPPGSEWQIILNEGCGG